MEKQPLYVIIGNGVAGATAAEILRQEDATASITMIADNAFPVYYRPALKDYLAARITEKKLWARTADFYQKNHIHCISHAATGLNATERTVQIANGEVVSYSHLIIATGARAKKLSCPGSDADGVFTLRTIGDYQQVIEDLPSTHRVVISGSGTLALETIETLRHRDLQVTHMIRGKRLWSEVLDATASDLVIQQERRDGVDVHVEEEIQEIKAETDHQGRTRVKEVITTRGTRIACEMVIVAIGVEPECDFLKGSGIAKGTGLKVNMATMQTNLPDVYAIGDVIEASDAQTGRARVLGQWYPAIQQAKAAAYHILGILDTSQPFASATFYNATCLYGLDFAAVGLPAIPQEDQHEFTEYSAEPKPRMYQKVILKQGIPVGALALGERQNVLTVKRAIDHRVNLASLQDRIFAPTFSLKDWLDQQDIPPTNLGVRRMRERAIQQVAYSGTHYPTIQEEQRPGMEGWLIPDFDPQSLQLPYIAAIKLSQTRVMTVGRREGIYLCIDHPSVSRDHAEICYKNGQFILHDLGSRNGTRLNQLKIEAGSIHILKDQDIVHFGKRMKFVFQEKEITFTPEKQVTPYETVPELPSFIVSHTPAGAAVAEQTIAQPVAQQTGLSPKEQRQPKLVVTSGMEKKTLLLEKQRVYSLGRAKQADLALPDITISRHHAEIFSTDQGFYVKDPGSSNGIAVNMTRITQPYLLAHGDTITIGNYSIVFYDYREVLDALHTMQAPVSTTESTPCQTCGSLIVQAARFCPVCGANTQRIDQPVR